MEVLKDNTILIDQLNNVDGYRSFSSVEIGACFTIKSLDLDEDRVLIKIEGETTEEYYFIPFVLKKLITSTFYKKICAEELKPIIKYLGKVKHKKIDDVEYHNFKIVMVIPEVINCE